MTEQQRQEWIVHVTQALDKFLDQTTKPEVTDEDQPLFPEIAEPPC